MTRKSGSKIFAPSWSLLAPAIERRKAGIKETEEDWKRYAEAYLKEMSRSYRTNRASWDSLLARDRVVLTCYCTNPQRCHRRILARILDTLGAKDCGELGA